MSVSVWESHSDVQEWSLRLPGFVGVVGNLSRMSGTDREALWRVN